MVPRPSAIAPGVSDRYSPEPDALMGASDTLHGGSLALAG